LAAPPRCYRHPRLSPDGRQLAVAIEGQETQIWLYDLSRETSTRLTVEGNANNPDWTPDGKRIIFDSNRVRGSESGLFWQLADGSGGAERLTTAPNGAGPWSSAGRVLAIDGNSTATGRDIYILRPGDSVLQPLVRTPFNEGSPTFSPDGRWLAYSSDASGRYEIYVQPYPGSGGRLQISTEKLVSMEGEAIHAACNRQMITLDLSLRRKEILWERGKWKLWRRIPAYRSPAGETQTFRGLVGLHMVHFTVAPSSQAQPVLP
jgi:Tol biopolymer transport system component